MKTNLQKAIDFLWGNKESYKDEIRNGEKPDFDAPKYCGLSEEIHRQLDNYEVDAIRNLWDQLLGWDTKVSCPVVQFKNKREYYCAVRKNIKEQIKNRKENVILGDFLAWAKKNHWWLRGFESIVRSFILNKDGTKKDGYSFVWATQMGFVSDEDIRKEIPKKTSEQWEAWGR